MPDVDLNTPIDKPLPFMCGKCGVQGVATFTDLGLVVATAGRMFRFYFKCSGCGSELQIEFSDMETLVDRLDSYRRGSKVFLSGTLKHSEGNDVGVPVYERGGEKVKRQPVLIVTAGGGAHEGYLHTRCIKTGNDAVITNVVEYCDGQGDPEWWRQDWLASIAAQRPDRED